MSTTDIEVLPETEDLSSSEQAALERIVAEGEMPQTDLWKALDLSSRGGSRIAQSLAEKGLIERLVAHRWKPLVTAYRRGFA